MGTARQTGTQWEQGALHRLAGPRGNECVDSVRHTVTGSREGGIEGEEWREPGQRGGRREKKKGRKEGGGSVDDSLRCSLCCGSINLDKQRNW